MIVSNVYMARLGQYDSYFSYSSKIHEKIQDFREIKWKNSQK